MCFRVFRFSGQIAHLIGVYNNCLYIETKSFFKGLDWLFKINPVVYLDCVHPAENYNPKQKSVQKKV